MMLFKSVCIRAYMHGGVHSGTGDLILGSVPYPHGRKGSGQEVSCNRFFSAYVRRLLCYAKYPCEDKWYRENKSSCPRFIQELDAGRVPANRYGTWSHRSSAIWRGRFQDARRGITGELRTFSGRVGRKTHITAATIFVE